MAKITAIEYFRVLPRWLFVKVTSEDGLYGWGESTLEGHTEAIEGSLDELIGRFVGYEADDIEHIWQVAWRLGFYRGGAVFMSAISGIDIALWDLKGKSPAGIGIGVAGRKLGVPVYSLLGGKLRDKLAVYSWIGGDRPSDVAAQAQERKDQGFTAIKMNATEDLGWLDSPSKLQSSVDRLAAVKAVGLDAGLDFHGRVHKPMARQLAKLLEPHQPLFIEEPLLSEHPEAIKAFSQHTTIPIALGERLYSRWDVKPFLESCSIDVLQPDVSHCGGISECRRIAAMCEAYDVGLAPHCPLGPISLAASIQIAVTSPNFVIQEMSLGIHYNKMTPPEAGEYDLCSYLKNPEVFAVKDGYVQTPKGVGLGIEIDEEAVRKVAVDCKAWRCLEFFGPGGEVREW